MNAAASAKPSDPSSHPRATPEGTRRFFERMRPERETMPYFGRFSRSLGSSDLQVSPIGFGCYRISDDNPTHHEALRLAILSGCNLIDTSTNYGDGASEKIVGDVIVELCAAQRLSRDEIVVITKAGYVQGSNMSLAKARLAEGRPFTEMVEYDTSVWHCISPDFLREQISLSLDRLQLDCLDALLLHNPEYFLKAGGDHREYYARIRKAFEYLETEVSEGRIARYGISSNTFPYPREADSYTSLEAIWDIAQEISEKRGDRHHFEVVQFPFNLYEPGAALEENNSGKSVLQFAHEKGLGTLANRPLNAFTEKGLVRLADFPAHDDRDIAGELKSAWTRAMELESAYPKIAPSPPVEPRHVAWGHILKHHFDRLNDIDAWKGALSHQIEPSLNSALARLSEVPTFEPWSRDYADASARLFQAFQAYLENQASYRSDLISSKIDHACPALHPSETLSEKVVRLYLSVDGMDCVLVGMRQPEYVRDLLDLKAPVSNDEAIRALKLVSVD